MIIIIILIFSCINILDCSLNGDCLDNKCVCDSQWKGNNCNVMNFENHNLSKGYHNKSYASWGGNVIKYNNKYHLFVSQISNKLDLSYYATNSQIIRTESNNFDGPYEMKQIILKPFAHNPQIMKYNNEYILFYIGNNTNNNQSHINYIKSSNLISWSIPYKVHINSFQTFYSNPSPLFYNNSIYLSYQSNKDSISISKTNNYSNNFNYITTITKNNNLCIAGMEEDPYIWRSNRGFHIISHGMCPSGVFQSRYHYSLDAIKWYKSLRDPYNYLIKLINGKNKLFYRMERPKLIIINNTLVGLINSVCDNNFNICNLKQKGMTYTIIRKLVINK